VVVSAGGWGWLGDFSEKNLIDFEFKKTIYIFEKKLIKG
jgi:hypothetical protein